MYFLVPTLVAEHDVWMMITMLCQREVGAIHFFSCVSIRTVASREPFVVDRADFGRFAFCTLFPAIMQFW